MLFRGRLDTHALFVENLFQLLLQDSFLYTGTILFDRHSFAIVLLPLYYQVPFSLYVVG